MNKTTGSAIISWDFSHGDDSGVLLVGERDGKAIEITNAFQGEEAKKILDLLRKRTGKEVLNG